MSAIIRYVAPNTQCINGTPRPEHHFWLNLSEYEDTQEVRTWVDYNTVPGTRAYWPETVATSPATGEVQFHVILHRDRDAMLFKLRW